jgi:hypothetical protein
MKKNDFEQLVKTEVQRQLRQLIPQLVKPLVQEAVAGALASLLAEGIVAGPPHRTVAAPVRRSRPPLEEYVDVEYEEAPLTAEHLLRDIAPAPRPAPRQVQPAPNLRRVREQLVPPVDFGRIGDRGAMTEMQPMPRVGGPAGDILRQTQEEMFGDAAGASILDNPEELQMLAEQGNINPAAAHAITKNYEKLMQRLNLA